ncbi:hypothetical protein [Massilia sp. METH4]
MLDLILQIAGPLVMKRYRAMRMAAGALLVAGIAIVAFAVVGR